MNAGSRRLQALGLIVVDGGRHEGLGTANRIVPLPGAAPGAPPQYLELLGVVDRREAEACDFGRGLLAGIAGGDRLVRWCLQTDQLDALATRLGLSPEPRSRRRPDGVRLSWRAAGLADSLRESWLPFFVAWDDPALHPGLTPVQHRVIPLGIPWVELATDDQPRLGRYLAGAGADVHLVDGAPSLRRCAIATAAGEIIIA